VFWNALYGFALDREQFAHPKVMTQAFDQVFKEGRFKDLSENEREQLTQLLTELYELLSDHSLQKLGVNPYDSGKTLETLTNLEMGARDTPAKAELQDRIRAKFAEIEKFASDALLAHSCPPPAAPVPETSQEPPATQPGTIFDVWRETQHPVVYGALKSFATSYQSCDVGFSSAITSSTKDVKGISIVGTHPNGVGKQRVISNLDALINSHPYLSNYIRPADTCFNVLRNPMIYDYGGKPYADNSLDSELNFFRDAGTGTSALGTDCSGFVYSALASAGLKLKESGRLKAINVMGVPASMYMKPQENGLTCFDYAAFDREQNIRPGDILASSGHIFIVEDVGPDPLGIGWIKNEANCTTSNIDVSKFDFTILHSSPVKGGIGILRMRAADYLKDGGSMTTAMIQHAVNACLAKTKKTKIVTRSSSASLVRHKGTAECLDRPIRLTYEDCLARCPAAPMLMSQRN